VGVKRGRLLALEGLDGSGKSTQAERIARALRDAGRDVDLTHEPTDGAMGRRIRAMARSGEAVAPAEELRWFVADRREHVECVIGPALAAGRWVVTDRYFLSTVAYQGARGLDWREILAASERDFPLPDVALVFEIDPRGGLARVRARGATSEPVFERADYLASVAAIFAAIDRPYVVRVDAEGSREAVTERALAALRARRVL